MPNDPHLIGFDLLFGIRHGNAGTNIPIQIDGNRVDPSQAVTESGQIIVGFDIPNSLSFSKFRDIELFLDLLKSDRGEGHQDQRVEADNQKHLCEAEIFGGDDLTLTRQLDAGDDVCQRGILDQVDELVAASGKGAAHGLGDDHPEHGFKRGKPQGLGRQDLPLF